MDCPRPSLGGNPLFAQCVARCRTEGLSCALPPPSSPPACCPAYLGVLSFLPPALREIDSALRRWGRFLPGWPSKLPGWGGSLGTWLAGRTSSLNKPVALTVRTFARHALPQPLSSPRTRCSRPHWRCQGPGHPSASKSALLLPSPYHLVLLPSMCAHGSGPVSPPRLDQCLRDRLCTTVSSTVI